MFEKLLEILAKTSTGKYYAIIICALIVLVSLAIWYGIDNIIIFLASFKIQYLSVPTFARALCISIFLVVCSMVLAGLSEIYLSEKYNIKIPQPLIILFATNTIVGIFMLALFISSIYSILIFSLLYLAFIPFDFLFRLVVANSAERFIKNARKEDSLNRAVCDEIWVYYVRYPKYCMILMRFFLTFTSIGFYNMSSNNASYIEFAYYIMIIMIVLNELYSWGYRLTMFNRVSRYYE